MYKPRAYRRAPTLKNPPRRVLITSTGSVAVRLRMGAVELDLFYLASRCISQWSPSSQMYSYNLCSGTGGNVLSYLSLGNDSSEHVPGDDIQDSET